MATTVKKILLKKKLAGGVVDIYPQTSADIVKYGESSTVAEELATLIAAVGSGGSVDDKITTAITAAKKELLGLDDTHTAISQAYDTLREVAEWIESDTTGAAKMAAEITALQVLLNGDPEVPTDKGLVGKVDGLAVTLNGDPDDDEDTGLVGQVSTIDSDLNTASTGLKAVVATHTTQIGELQSGKSGVQVVASDFDTDTMNGTDLYCVELPAPANGE